MRIKMLTSIAGPSWSASPGDEIEVSGEEGQRLITSGQALPVRQIETETETLKRPLETAVIRRSKRGR